MKDLFPAYYKGPDDANPDWDEAVFSLDTNALLRILSFSAKGREEWLKGLNYLRKEGRLFLSYQAAYEYHRHVQTEIGKTKQNLIGTWQKPVSDMVQSLSQLLKNEQDPLHGVQELHDACEAILKEGNSFSGGLKKTLDQCGESYLKEAWKCHQDISDVFDGLVGPKPDPERTRSWCLEAESRARQNIPPGYADRGKEVGNPFGDQLIWFQMIEHAKVVKKPLLFVTYEQKGDWIEKGARRARKELENEMLLETGVPFGIAFPDEFLKWSVSKAGVEQPVSIEETERAMVESGEEQLKLEIELSESALKKLAELSPDESSVVHSALRSFIGTAVSPKTSAIGVMLGGNKLLSVGVKTVSGKKLMTDFTIYPYPGLA